MKHGTLSRPGRPVLKKVLIIVLIALLALAAGIFLAFRYSPWPEVLLIRKVFAEDAAKLNNALSKHVPPGITAITNEQYDPGDKDAFLDVYFPSTLNNTEKVLPVIVWVHGGAWISGNKEQVGNYCKILAGKGFTVVSIDYSIAPGKKYPTPVHQLNTSLAYLAKHAQRFHINASKFILAGDSGGAHIAAQEANVLTVPSYAALLEIAPSIPRSHLAGLLLFCGAYDMGKINLDGEFGEFLKTVLWSYSGEKNYMTDPRFASASIIQYITPSYPPVFISAGNADPLAPHSYSMARKLAMEGVKVDSLFFPADYTPALPHEYQFNLDTEAGRLALDRSVQFLDGLGLQRAAP